MAVTANMREMRARIDARKLAAEQRRAVKSLVEDGDYSRAEAVAWVLAMGGT